MGATLGPGLVQVAGFTFELASVEQIPACLAFFAVRIYPSSTLDANDWSDVR